MSVHVCKCEHNGRTEYHIRYPGLTQQDAQALADNINSGQLVGADHPLRKDAERYRWLRQREVEIRRYALVGVRASERIDDHIDAAIEEERAVGAA